MQLGPGRVADDPEPVGDAKAAVMGERRAAGRVEPVVLEAEVVERELPADGKQNGVALDARAVVEVDDVGAVGSGTLPGALGAHAEPHRDARLPQRGEDRRRVARVLRGHEPGP